jgi:ABC-2 type transport system permease protein
MTAVSINHPSAAVRGSRASAFVNVLRSEWTKTRTVPSTVWALLIAIVLGIGLGALISALAAHQYAKDGPASRALWDPTSISGGGLEIAQLAIGVLGVLLITSEYSTHAIGISLVAVPRRARLLAAKATVIALLTFIVAEFVTFVAFFVGQAVISGKAPTANLGQPDVLRALIGSGLYGALIGLLGLALGTILRHAAGAIAVLVALLYVLPGIVAALPASIEHTVEEFWPTQAGQEVTVVVRGAHTLSAWTGFGLFLIFVGVVLLFAFVIMARRDA